MSTLELIACVIASPIEESQENSLGDNLQNWNEPAMFYITEDEEKYANSF